MIRTITPEKYVTYFSTKQTTTNHLNQRNEENNGIQNHYTPSQESKRIAIPSQNEVVFVELKQIVGFEANGNYTKIHLRSGKQYLVCQTLRKFEDRLSDHLFMRFNRKWLVNILLVDRYIKRDKCVVLTNGMMVSLSDKHKSNFFCSLNNPAFLW